MCCWVTLCGEGMTTTSGLEAELSSRTRETSKRRLKAEGVRGEQPPADERHHPGLQWMSRIVETGEVTMRMSPEDHPLTTTTADVPGEKPQVRSRNVM